MQSNLQQAKEAVAKAKKTLGYRTKGKPTLPSDLNKYVEPLLQKCQNTLERIIARMHLTCGSGSPQTDLETIIRSHPVSQKKVNAIANHMCGWVKRAVDLKLEKGEPAIVSRDEFHTAYISFCRSIDRDTILKSLGRKPTQEEALERLPDVFVQQLGLIDLSFEEQLSAVADYLRACWDRAYWAQEGEVDPTSFDELDDNLTRTWKNHVDGVAIELQNRTDVDRGKLVYARCKQHNARVQGMEPPAHFVPGCYHRLADSEDVGWHPAYSTLMAKSREVETA